MVSSLTRFTRVESPVLCAGNDLKIIINNSEKRFYGQLLLHPPAFFLISRIPLPGAGFLTEAVADAELNIPVDLEIAEFGPDPVHRAANSGGAALKSVIQI